MIQVDILTRIESLLQVERHMIKDGNFGALASLAATKDGLMRELLEAPQVKPLSPEIFARVRAMAERNQQLIQAALKGIRAAQKRLDHIQRASKSLQSYDRLGRHKTIGASTSSIERRA